MTASARKMLGSLRPLIDSMRGDVEAAPSGSMCVSLSLLVVHLLESCDLSYALSIRVQNLRPLVFKLHAAWHACIACSIL